MAQGRGGESGEFPVGRFTFGPVEDFLLLTFVTLVLSSLKVGYTRSAF